MKKTNQKQVEKNKFSILNFQFSIVLLLAAVLTLSCGNTGNKQKANENDNEASSSSVKTKEKDVTEKKLPFEFGSYVEESNMMGMDLKKTVYFDKWGDWTATEDKSEIKMMGITIKTHKLEIVKGKIHWDLDLIEKTGTRYEVPTIPQNIAVSLAAAAVGGKMMEGMEMKELGEENYLGYNCKKISVKYDSMNMETTILSYGNLTMKMDGNMGGMTISTKVASIDLTKPSPAIFEVPDDIEIIVE